MTNPLHPFSGGISRRARQIVFTLAVLSVPPLLVGCTPAAEAPVNPAQAIDADPLALFPAGAAAVATLDVRTFYASGAAGAQVAALVESLIPAGQEVAFSMARDVDRMAIGLYAALSVDAVAVLSGRFDPARLQAAAAARTLSRSGAPWVVTTYGGRPLYSASSVALAPLTDHTLVAGSESAVRRVLDRLARPGAPARQPRELAPWMFATLEAPGSAFACALDMASVAPGSLHGLSLPPALASLSRAATVGDFHPPGLNVASTLTYADASRAASGADALRQLAALVNIAAAVGAAPRIQNLSLTPEGANVACKFELDDEAMRRALGSVLRLLAPTAQRPPG